MRSIFQLMPKCKGQKVQSQESVFYQGQWAVFFFNLAFAVYYFPCLLAVAILTGFCFFLFLCSLFLWVFYQAAKIQYCIGTWPCKVSSGYGTKAIPMVTTMRCCLATRELKRKVLAKSPNLCRWGALQDPAVGWWAGPGLSFSHSWDSSYQVFLCHIAATC